MKSTAASLAGKIRISVTSEIRQLRKQIDRLDHAIILQIAGRLAVARQIGALKKNLHVQVRDLKREQQVHKFHQKLSKLHKISLPTIKKIFNLLMEESRRIQK